MISFFARFSFYGHCLIRLQTSKKRRRRRTNTKFNFRCYRSSEREIWMRIFLSFFCSIALCSFTTRREKVSTSYYLYAITVLSSAMSRERERERQEEERGEQKKSLSLLFERSPLTRNGNSSRKQHRPSKLISLLLPVLVSSMVHRADNSSTLFI